MNASRFRPRREDSAASPGPALSLIIPFHNESEHLGPCLEAIQRSSFADFELLLVDDASSDGSTDVAASFSRTVLHTGGRAGPAAARNLGIECARAPILVFIDADVRVGRDTLRDLHHLMSLLPDHGAVIGTVSGRAIPNSFVGSYNHLFRCYIDLQLPPDVSFFYTGFGALRREAIQEVGLFDARYRSPDIEDVEYGDRLVEAGRRIRLDRGLVIDHDKAYGLIDFMKVRLRRSYYYSAFLLERRASLRRRRHALQGTSLGFLAALLACHLDLLALFLALWRPSRIGVLGFIGACLISLTLNWRFLSFIGRQAGRLFALNAFLLLHLDMAVVSSGSACGAFLFAVRKVGRRLGGGGRGGGL